MANPPPPARLPLLGKFVEITLALIGVANCLQIGLSSLPPAWLARPGWGLLFGLLNALPLWVAVGAGLTWRWQRGVRRVEPPAPGLAPAEQYPATGRLAGDGWQAIIRYWLAFALADYAFSKLVDYQFQTASFTLAQPLGTVSGAALTWYYFGYAPLFGQLLGGLQLAGAALLLGRRTTLLGALVLLPVMANIVLINLFYHIGAGPLQNAVLYTGALGFLVVPHGRRLWAALFPPLPARRGGGAGPWVGRVAALAGAAAVVYAAKAGQPTDPALRGVWRVERLVRAGRRVPLDSVGTDPQGWTRFYFAQARRSRCAIRYHPDKYEPHRELRGDYVYDPARRRLRAGFRHDGQPTDSLVAVVYLPDAHHLRLIGRFGADSVEVALVRLAP